MLSVSLDCSFSILCSLCCQFLWIVHSVSCVLYVASFSGLFIQYLVFSMLPVSLDCSFSILCSLCCQFLWIVHSVSCVLYVASFSGLFIQYLVFSMLPVSLDCSFSILCSLCCQFLWIVHFWLPLLYSLAFFFIPFLHVTSTRLFKIRINQILIFNKISNKSNKTWQVPLVEQELL